MKRTLDDNGYTNWIMIAIVVGIIILSSVLLLSFTKGDPTKEQKFIELKVPIEGIKDGDKELTYFSTRMDAKTSVIEKTMMFDFSSLSIDYHKNKTLTVEMTKVGDGPVDEMSREISYDDGEYGYESFVMGPVEENNTYYFEISLSPALGDDTGLNLYRNSQNGDGEAIEVEV